MCVEVINVSELDPHIKNPFIILRGIPAGKTPIINDNCLSHMCINSIKRHTHMVRIPNLLEIPNTDHTGRFDFSQSGPSDSGETDLAVSEYKGFSLLKRKREEKIGLGALVMNRTASR